MTITSRFPAQDDGESIEGEYQQDYQMNYTMPGAHYGDASQAYINADRSKAISEEDEYGDRSMAHSSTAGSHASRYSSRVSELV